MSTLGDQWPSVILQCNHRRLPSTVLAGRRLHQLQLPLVQVQKHYRLELRPLSAVRLCSECELNTWSSQYTLQPDASSSYYFRNLSRNTSAVAEASTWQRAQL